MQQNTAPMKEITDIIPDFLPMKINESLITEVMTRAKKENKWVLAFVLGTKPCFYKFWGSIQAADKLGIPNFIIYADQHYDDLLTTGMREFNLTHKVAVNLAIRGDLVQKSAELLLKIKWFANHLEQTHPGVIVAPIVLGDTILTGIVPPAWMFTRHEKAIQNEAGLRSMAPDIMRRPESVSSETFIDQQFYGKWHSLKNEPFPEQWDTFAAAAGSEFLFAPTELNRQHLIHEGHPESNIWVIGGVVVDALELKKKEKPEQSIFDIYPQLEKGSWIRMDIHRRENLTERRFRSIIGATKELVKKGYNINFIEMNATRAALQQYDLRNEILKLKENKNFLLTDVWPEFGNVIEFYNSPHLFASLTDSGGVQEEMNLLKKPCLTCRFSTERPETVNDAKSNLLVPPLSSDFIVKIVDHFNKNESLQKEMSNSKHLYGENVGEKLVVQLKTLMDSGESLFKWSHEALGLWKETSKSKYL